MPGSSPITTRGPAGAASSRSRRLSAKTLIATVSASSRRRANRSRSRLRLSLTFQVQAMHLADQVVARRAGVAPAQVHARCGLRPAPGWPGTTSSSSTSLASSNSSVRPRNTASARCDGTRADRLGVVEVVAELGGVGVVAVLAVDQLALEQRPRPTAIRAACPPARRLRPSARTGCRARRRAPPARRQSRAVGVDEGRGFGQRVERRVGEQLVGQRLQAGLARDHALGAALAACRAGRGLPAPAWSARPRSAARSAGVSLPCSSMLLSTAARRSSSSRR